MLVPVTCPLCGNPGAAPCESCLAGLAPAPEVAPPPGLDRCVALWAHEGGARTLVAALKYRNARRVVPRVGALLADEVAELQPWLGVVDSVVPVPASLQRRNERGFDQAQLLARRVARRLGAPVVEAVVRADHRGQTGRARHERLAGANFTARHGARVGATVVVVDDVCTTGASVSHAAQVVRELGAWRVVGAVLTRRDRAPADAGGRSPVDRPPWARDRQGHLA